MSKISLSRLRWRLWCPTKRNDRAAKEFASSQGGIFFGFLPRMLLKELGLPANKAPTSRQQHLTSPKKILRKVVEFSRTDVSCNDGRKWWLKSLKLGKNPFKALSAGNCVCLLEGDVEASLHCFGM